MRKIKVAVVTGSRADYGLLSNFLMEAKKEFKLSLIVTGAHLNYGFGNSLNEIKKDKIKISKKINLNIQDKKGAVANSISLGIKKFNKYFEKNSFDYVILLGDRYEILSCAIAAMVIRYPIIHLHGGETTTNSFDEYFRHSISIFSQYHFVAAEKYFKRVMQLGKNPKTIFKVGGLGVANIKRIKFQKKNDIEQKLKIKFKDKNIFFIYHPETLEKNYGEKGLENCLKVLSGFKNYLVIISTPNADTKYSKFRKKIFQYAKKNDHFKIISTIKHDTFLSCMKFIDVIVGNSSSGILEAPSLKVPTLNIGSRQDGRLRARSIIDSGYGFKEIQIKLKRLINLKRKKNIYANPYDYGDSIKKIIKIIKNLKKLKIEKNKKFYNII